MNSKNTRRHYRINYPTAEKAEAVWNGHKMFIRDLSESGVALITQDGIPNAENFKNHKIVIYMLNGFAHDTEADFMRMSESNEYIFILKDLVPYSEIMKEQRLLIDKYGTLLDSNS